MNCVLSFSRTCLCKLTFHAISLACPVWYVLCILTAPTNSSHSCSRHASSHSHVCLSPRQSRLMHPDRDLGIVSIFLPLLHVRRAASAKSARRGRIGPAIVPSPPREEFRSVGAVLSSRPRSPQQPCPPLPPMCTHT